MYTYIDNTRMAPVYEWPATSTAQPPHILAVVKGPCKVPPIMNALCNVRSIRHRASWHVDAWKNAKCCLAGFL